MKKLLVPFAAVLLFSVSSIPQSVQGQEKKNPETMSKKALRISGTVDQDGHVLVSDKDSKTWKVVNSDALKDNEGRHVTVKARVDADTSEIYITSVKKATPPGASIKLDDSAFRR